MDNIAIHCHKGHFGAQLIGDFHLIETNSLPIFHLLCHRRQMLSDCTYIIISNFITC